MLNSIIGFHPSFTALLLRLCLGIIFIVHGYPKLFKEDYGPVGFSNFLKNYGVPSPVFFAYTLGIVEFVGGWLLIVGLMTRLAALLIAIDMAVVLWKVKFKTGLVTRVLDNGRAGGYELELALFVMAFSISIFGAGKFSIDYLYLRVW